MRTQGLCSIATLASCLALVGCDQPDEPVDTGASSAPKDGKNDDAEPESEGGEETGDGSTGDAPEPMATDGAMPSVPAECEALCQCVEGLGEDRWACGQQCRDDLADDNPDDRSQCVAGLADNDLSSCAAECDALSDGG